MFKVSHRFGLGLAAVAAVGMFSSMASASWGNRVLLNAMPGLFQPGTWQGQTQFFSTNGVRSLDITVDYAVFAPGQFPGNYTPFAGFLMPPANDYLYAYQVYNTGVANGGLSTTQFSQLGIDTLGPVSSLGKDQSGVGPTGDAGGINTNFAFLSQQGASYLFLVPSIQVDEYSIVLLYSSPIGPSFSNATVYDSGLSATGNLPTPIPAPASAALALAGLGAVARRRR